MKKAPPLQRTQGNVAPCLTLFLCLLQAKSIHVLATASQESTVSKNANDSSFQNIAVQAYPCNPSTHEPEDPHPIIHQAGSPLTICVEVEEEGNGITIEGIDSFSWTKKEPEDVPDLFQVAIEDGTTPSDKSTVCDCPPGSRICSFRSTLVSNFYESMGEIIGQGQVRLGRRRNQGQRVLSSSASMGVEVQVEQASESDRPSLKTAGGTRPTKHWCILTSLGIAVVWIILGGV